MPRTCSRNSSIIYNFHNPLNLLLSCKVVGFGPPICSGMRCPRFRTCILKWHLLLTMWPNMVEFRSASSAGSWRKKERKRKKKKSVVKYKSADNCVGRSNITNVSCIEQWFSTFFTARHNAARCTSYSISVCPSVCPIHAGTVSKRMNTGWCCLHSWLTSVTCI